jgi:hypothetical protein
MGNDASAKGSDSGSSLGTGVSGWSGFRNVSWSHSLHKEISLKRSVTISEKVHQAGGFGYPSKVRRRAMYASTPPNKMIDWAAAEAE